MTIKNRIEKLETAAGIFDRPGYLCVINQTKEPPAQYKIQPFTKEANGTGEEAFYLDPAAFAVFRDRDDIELTIINVTYAGTPANT